MFSREKVTSNNSVGHIVSFMPQAAEVFKKYGIDFCCGGDRPLSDVIKEQGLDENEILKSIESAQKDSDSERGNRNFLEMSSEELIQHIENTHHSYMKRTLPELDELIFKIMKVHGTNHPELFQIHKLFSSLKAELEQHLVKEEEVLFPLINEYQEEAIEIHTKKMVDLIKDTEEEHDVAGEALKKLRSITNDYDVPVDACSTYELTFRRLGELEADLFQHIHLENNILFKKFND